MATSSDDIKKITNRKFKDGDNEHYAWNRWVFKGDESYRCPTYVHRTPPCQGSCPSGHDIRGWLDIVRGIEKPAEGMDWKEYAFRRNTEANPFPSIMGRVCPAPCEDGCNRNKVEEHVGINSVEQFIGDNALAAGYQFEAGPDTGKKVAIIGGGPAGLAAAYQLRRRGHGATIFESKPGLGGMMRYGIPGYRTPRNVLDGEIQRILDLGVEVHTNTKVGVDISMEDIEKEFDAVLFAIGAWSGRALPIPGGDKATNCITGVAFLEAFNQGRLKHVTGKVVVVGGGDTSIDVASVARRLGHIDVVSEKDRPEHVIINQTAHDVVESAARQGADVLLMSRAPIEKMNAAKHEIDDALREGVEIRGRLNPVEVILGEDGRAKALRVQELQEDGKTPVEGSEFDIECDLIVAAIGQGGDLTGMETFGNQRGLIDADKHYQVPGKEGYFVCGDIVRPHLLTTAIGQASIAVDSIDGYLQQKDLGKRPKVDVHHFNLLEKLRETHLEPAPFQLEAKDSVYKKETDLGARGTSEAKFAVHNYEDRSQSEIIPADELFLGHFPFTPRNRRQHVEVSAENVLGNFEERLVALDEEKTVAEAKRCMSCGMCFECDNCVVFCPQEAVKKTPKAEATMGRYVYTDYSRCIGCHICADVCPTGYIEMGLGAWAN
ncbi:NAD(P)-binding protein [Thioalbus denitrificans]|uniref:NADPH-dependent glutamate synthase beta subunit-like oxidoreductase n=1 Tax=Thioalbus denitrificans TaxID=547122 RepID=A0A369CE41_9GAMM|nr:NAD(P)-binding protein [Thioalbus denitrificans]RCX31963.1 NADPH-dependent glutamate synthase beta subunit-like oxidoreductase [Thioalbus denitrificans]